MSLTRASVEQIVIRRLGRLLTKAGLDGTTISGSNPDLNDPIGWAIRQCGGSVSTLTSVTSTDTASVSDTHLDKMLDLAEFRTLETIAGNFDQVSFTAGPISEDTTDLMQVIETRLKRKRDQLKQDYGFGLNSGSGLITLLRDDYGRFA